MRRLAKQRREDAYSSRRDYQVIEVAPSLEYQPSATGTHQVAFEIPGTDFLDPVIGFGGFVQAASGVEMLVCLEHPRETVDKRIDVGPAWQRFGVLMPAADMQDVCASISWDGAASISLWGIAGGALELPGELQRRAPSIDDLSKDHLAPETWYFDHDAATLLEPSFAGSTLISERPGPEIELKKCAYCRRRLALDSSRPGALSFHKHNAKLTNHQNECRACKKWRINDAFNPIRTHDQLHESSVITRERKTFLREPEILQRIKDRDGAGLKSQIWQRFGGQCFYCRRGLSLDEVQLDHTRPLAYLWPIDEYATCLCAEHNNQKGDRFPVDFYSPTQLERLSQISGLPYAELSRKELNWSELQRIRYDLPRFAQQWDPRHFAATARKVAELSEVDLFSELEAADPATFRSVVQRLKERPPALDGDPVICE